MALATFPERGTRRDDILPGLRTIGFERRATIAFRVLKTRVEIVSLPMGAGILRAGCARANKSGAH
jgi:toxin ParE1/3/4